MLRETCERVQASGLAAVQLLCFSIPWYRDESETARTAEVTAVPLPAEKHVRPPPKMHLSALPKRKSKVVGPHRRSPTEESQCLRFGTRMRTPGSALKPTLGNTKKNDIF